MSDQDRAEETEKVTDTETEKVTEAESAPAAGETTEETPEQSPEEEAAARIAELEDQLARARAETYNVSQEYAGFVRRAKAEQVAAKESGKQSVIDALLSVLDDIELTRAHGELTGSAGASCEKLENTLAANFDLHRFGAEGDEFDPTMHEALMHATGEVETEQIQTLIQPGYRIGDKVIRPARVGVVSPQ